jgi:hypothetical protein
MSTFNTKKFITLTVLTIFSSFVFSQFNEFEPSNMREGESIEYCLQHKIHNKMMENPDYRASYLADKEIQQQVIEMMKNDENFARGVVYKIPVVFHVLHNGGVENITNDQIFDCLRIMNRDFRRENEDAALVHADFQGEPSDSEIEFVMATKAPNGACFNGITRTQSPMSYDGSNGYAQVNAIVAGNDVYNGEWPGNRYLNVFICGDIGGAAGYTNYPSNWGGTNMRNGIWVLHTYVGSIGTGDAVRSRTLTHEVGHWLNLPHTWGDSNNPGLSENCNDDDGVSDTPTCIGVTSCSLNSNSCDNDNAYWGFDKRDNVENYMEYSYCDKMFTAGQSSRMRAALNSTVGSRNNLWTNANLQLTGADGNTYLCKANFRANNLSICVGESIQFEDISFNSASSWSWEFEGGIPAVSTAQNPLVSYPNPGKYKVVLRVSDGSNTLEESKESYITVLAQSSNLAFSRRIRGLPNS